MIIVEVVLFFNEFIQILQFESFKIQKLRLVGNAQKLLHEVTYL